MNLKTILLRHPVLAYFLLVYGIAWGGILIILGPAGLQPASTRPMEIVLVVFGAMLAGPAISALVLTAILNGKAGLKELLSRWLRWRLQLRWYSIALLTTPALLLVIWGLLSIVSPAYVPSLIASSDKATLVIFGLMIGLMAGFFEEIGWTGFATPRMLASRGALTTGLILGALWGAWHLLGDYWGNAGAFGPLYIVRGFLWVATLTAYRMLMIQVYQRTTSLSLMQLMHAAFTGSQAILGPSVAPADYLMWYGLFSIGIWALVGLVVLSQRRNLQVAQSRITNPN